MRRAVFSDRLNRCSKIVGRSGVSVWALADSWFSICSARDDGAGSLCPHNSAQQRNINANTEDTFIQKRSPFLCSEGSLGGYCTKGAAKKPWKAAEKRNMRTVSLHNERKEGNTRGSRSTRNSVARNLVTFVLLVFRVPVLLCKAAVTQKRA